MTPEQRELLLRTQLFIFRFKDDQYVFKAYSSFPFLIHECNFPSFENMLGYARSVLIECGSSWEAHPRAPQLIDWLTENIMTTGCSIEWVCDRELHRAFMLAHGTEDPLFADLHKAVLDNKANKET